MSKFDDTKARTWTLDINLLTVDVVHKETGVSLLTLFDEQAQGLQQLLANLPALAHVCYILADAGGDGVSQADFAKALKGDTIGAMTAAFLEALTDFFPDARRRAFLAKIQASWEAMEIKALNLLASEVTKIDPDQLADAALTRMLSTKSGSSPASSPSIPEE